MQGALFGIETEYGLAVLRLGEDEATRRDCDRVGDALIKEVRRRHPTLPDGSVRGAFLANGSRIYMDIGAHPESSTPECTRPEELVRYALAGDEILAGAAVKLEGRYKHAEIHLFKTNVDYTSLQTWGSHESYLCGRDHRELAGSIVPHLVTRIVYTGAGGFRPTSYGVEFVISPRAFFLVHAVSQGGVDGRGVFDLRDEPHAQRPYRRMHLLCGESLCGELGQYLRLGTTALVVRMAEMGLPKLAEFELYDPVCAIYDVSRDPALRGKVRLKDGRSLTAVQLQRLYLELAERHLGMEFMPDWAGDVCVRWRAMLDALEDGPESVAAVLDWAIKLNIFRGHCRERGVAWDLLPVFSEAAYLMVSEGVVPPRSVCDEESVAAWLSVPPPVRPTAVRTHLVRHGLNWEQLLLFLAVREELFEIDRSFATLGSRSLFRKLEAAGLLDHQLDIGISTEAAVDQPSSCPRAVLRGDAVRELAGQGHECLVNWSYVLDHTNRQELRLGDPFAEAGNWTPLTGSDCSEAGIRGVGVRARRRAQAARLALLGARL